MANKAQTSKSKASKGKAENVKIYFIKSHSPNGFRRLGFRFTPQGFGIAEDLLSESDIEMLKAEPELSVEIREVSAEKFENAKLVGR